MASDLKGGKAGLKYLRWGQRCNTPVETAEVFPAVFFFTSNCKSKIRRKQWKGSPDGQTPASNSQLVCSRILARETGKSIKAVELAASRKDG
jgi:hypothetical protein